MPDQDALELLLDPGRSAKHHVDVDARSGVDPLVARFPEGVADLGVARERRGDGVPMLQEHGLRGIDVEVDVGGVVDGAGEP